MTYLVIRNDNEVVHKNNTLEAADKEAQHLSSGSLGWYTVSEIKRVYKRGNLLATSEKGEDISNQSTE